MSPNREGAATFFFVVFGCVVLVDMVVSCCVQVHGKAFLPFGAAGTEHLKLAASTQQTGKTLHNFTPEGLSLLLSSGHLLLEEVSTAFYHFKRLVVLKWELGDMMTCYKLQH